MDNHCVENTDIELWREKEGDYYADSIHVTENGKIGMNVGGHVIVMPIKEWHKVADVDKLLVERPGAGEATYTLEQIKEAWDSVGMDCWPEYVDCLKASAPTVQEIDTAHCTECTERAKRQKMDNALYKIRTGKIGGELNAKIKQEGKKKVRSNG